LKALVDTNVILDAIAAREPFRRDAENIVLMAAEEKMEGFISAKSAADIYYVACSLDSRTL
jgi:predicted nucleic acid-binding protein